MESSQVTAFGWKGHFERFAAPILQRDRFFMGMVLALMVAFAEAFALASLVPLHSSVPYVIQTDASGRVIASGQVAVEAGKPTTAELTYWLGQWTSGLYQVDPAYSSANLRNDYLFTYGPAVGQMSRFLKSPESPISMLNANPSLRTEATVASVRDIGADEAYVVVNVHNLLTGKTEQHGVTISYRLQPPKKVDAALANPIGLQITNFSLYGDS